MNRMHSIVCGVRYLLCVEDRGVEGLVQGFLRSEFGIRWKVRRSVTGWCLDGLVRNDFYV